MTDQLGHAMETNASGSQLEFRQALEEAFRHREMPDEHLMCNFGLFMRASALVKILVLDDLYRRIVHLPGAIMEFGTWWGQNMVLFENLRAIHEPLNKTRRIIGFDTFSGYDGFSDHDQPGDVVTEGSYAVRPGYGAHLEKLLEVHEGNNVMGHLRGRHSAVEGDVRETVPAYFKTHPETVVAMAYFDLALYEPTRACLEAIRPHLIPGSIVLLDEFAWSDTPGEAIAFKEVLGDMRYTIERSKYTAERAIVTIGAS